MRRRCTSTEEIRKIKPSVSNMGRLLSISCRLKVGLFILICCLNCLTASSLTVEERLQALETTNIEIKQILAAKTVRLEALEIEVEQLKSIVIALKSERDVANKKDVTAISNQPSGKSAIFRTCRETHLADPSLASGLHWIDPDGQGVGDGPIQVYCDMATGTTSILHDSESPTNVGHCADPGCYSKTVNYSATKRQLTALVELSSECHQLIRYDCNSAPFETNGVANSWWDDRNGNRQYFWAGSNASVHTCQCGIDHNCLESSLTCNCDSNLPIPEFDSGLITNKNLLPVTQLNFGRTLLEISSGVYTLGRFECSGTVAIDGMASSCTDLWQIGHNLNGLYSVMGTSMIESVYCDFSKLPSERGFETRLGYVDVKFLPVYFYVQRNYNFNTEGAPIPFQIGVTNIGDAMNVTSGIFTAPRKGVYFFTFSGMADFTSTSECALGIDLTLNGGRVGRGYVVRTGGSSRDDYTISLQSTITLKAGDRVWLQINTMFNAVLFDDVDHHTHFTGQLLQENISEFSTSSLL